MPATVNVHDAKTNFSKLLERAHAGEEIVVAKAGKPYARLVPLAPPAKKEPRRPGALKGVLPELPDSFFFDPLPQEELRLWEGR